MKDDIEISERKQESSQKQLMAPQQLMATTQLMATPQLMATSQLMAMCVMSISTLERENKDQTNILDLQIDTNIKSSEYIHVRYTRKK